MSAEDRFCTFYLDGLCFGIAVERVQEAIFSPTVTPVPLAPRAVAGLTNLRGQIVTVIDLPRCLGLEARSAVTSPAMVVVRSENFPMGLLVDELGEVVGAPEHLCEASPGNLPAELRKLVPAVCKLPRRVLHLLDLDKVLVGDSREAQSGKAMK